uniref:Uncharacterized protein n=1 Tax=Rhizophora mucronata TaxID=61149 RepID=A0A2P2JHA5_RHIMU
MNFKRWTKILYFQGCHQQRYFHGGTKWRGSVHKSSLVKAKVPFNH